MMRKRPFTLDPFALWKTGFDMWQMTLEAQSVIAMRMMGMAGMWNVTPSESTRMITEKQIAFFNAAVDASRATATGKSAEKIVQAGVKPLRRKTRSNTNRLLRRGPKSLK